MTCLEKRRRFLRTVELYGSWKPMCFNCHGMIGLLAPMPKTISQLKDAISRERRKRDRRWGKPDSRVFIYERRVGERRFGRESDVPAVDDEMIIEITVDDELMKLVGGHDDFDQDITAIRELVHSLRPADLAG